MNAAAPLVLRAWQEGDAPALARHANNREIWIRLRDRFPHPYRLADAEDWIARCLAEDDPPAHLAVEHDGEAIGGVGVERMTDVHRLVAEIGYWIAQPFWGRGFATIAVAATVRYAFERFDFQRLQAFVHEGNGASERVLERCGFVREGLLRRYFVKDGRIGDALLFARLRDGPARA